MNRARCAHCMDLIHSKHRHDFVECACGAIFIDGGDDYCRAGGKPEDFIFVQDDGTEIPMMKEADDGGSDQEERVDEPTTGQGMPT